MRDEEVAQTVTRIVESFDKRTGQKIEIFFKGRCDSNQTRGRGVGIIVSSCFSGCVRDISPHESLQQAQNEGGCGHYKVCARSYDTNCGHYVDRGINLHVVYGFAAGNERIDKTEQVLINVYNNMRQSMSEMNLIGGDFNIVDGNISLSEQWSLTDLA